jgi:hypothetical protein
MADRQPVVSEIWMRIKDSETMHFVGTVSYEESDTPTGVLTTKDFHASISEFIEAVNEVMRKRAG